MYEFRLPDLGEGIADGEILKWHVAVGEVVGEDEPLVDMETDKAAVTIPSPKGGEVISLAGGEGDIVNVGDVVAVIDDGSGEAVMVRIGKKAAGNLLDGERWAQFPKEASNE